MSKKNIFLVVLLVLCSGAAAFGQSNINSTVTVTKELEGKLLGAQKSQFGTDYSDTLYKLNLDFDYSVFDSPYRDLYEFSPVDGIQMQKRGEVRYPVLYLKGALSYPWMGDADLYIQPRLGGRNSLVFYGNHDSMWGNPESMDSQLPVNRSVTKSGFGYGHNWSEGEFVLNGFYKHNHHNIADADLYKYDPRALHNVGGSVMLRSLNADRDAFHYLAGAKVVYTKSSDKISEVMADVDVELGANIKDHHKAFVAFGLKHSTSEILWIMNQKYGHKSGLYEIVPQYSYNTDRVNLSVGVGFSGIYGKVKEYTVGEDKQLNVVAYPKLLFSWEAVKSAMKFNFRVDGENVYYSCFDLLERNPWLGMVMPEISSIPVRAELEVEGSVNDVFGYSLSGRYARHRSFLSFAGMQGIQYSILTSGVNELAFEPKISIKTKSVDFRAGFEYRNFGDAVVFMTPDWKVSTSFEYNYIERIYAELGLRYFSKMTGYGKEYAGFADLSAQFKYVVNSKFSLFAKVNNILDNQIYYLQDYIEPGANFTLGLFLKL